MKPTLFFDIKKKILKIIVSTIILETSHFAYVLGRACVALKRLYLINKFLTGSAKIGT